MLRERDDDPQRRLEVINIHQERRVVLAPKCVFTLNVLIALVLN